jgi:hypothetical protein
MMEDLLWSPLMPLQVNCEPGHDGRSTLVIFDATTSKLQWYYYK